jgi:iterative type I PKS product template protein
MMLRERQVPPQPGAPFTLNHKFPPLSDINIKIATKPGALKPSPRGDKKIKALVNSFDASGGNVTLAVQEPPPCATTIKPADPRGWHVVAVSARSAYSLQQNRIRLLDYLESRPETKLADLGYSTTARRIHEPLRCAYTGSSTGDILRQIRKDVQDHQQQEATSVSSGSRTVTTTRRSRNRSLIFLFTGQGSQYAGMGAHLYRDHEGFRSMLLGYQELATGMGLPKFIHLISDTTTDVSSNAEASTAQTQLAIVALEIALAQLLKAWGIMPDVVIGHSLGEYAALCVAGVLSVSDTLLLVGRRAVLMEKHLTANTYAMLATSLTSESLHEMFGELHLTSCSVACENAPSVTIASGTLQDIEILQQHLTTARGMKTKLLPVPYGFHSDQVEPILDEYQQVARGVHFGKPKVPVVSTLTAKVERGDSDSAFGPAYLTQQARHRVKFVQALEACRAAGLADDGSLWLEIGPKPVLMGLARQTLALPVEDVIPTLDSRHDNWHTISGMLRTLYQSGIQVDWPEVHRHFVPSLTLLNLPTYAFDMRDFWTPYKEPERVVQMVSVDDKMVSGGKTGTSPVPGFPTSSVQAVEDERIDGNAITATFASSMSHPSLLEAIKGHGVNGHTICPLGVFHDMALTAASYLFTRLHSSSRNNTKEKVDGEAPRMSIQAMDMTHALALSTESLDATIYVAGTYRAEDKFVEVMFTSNSGLGRPSMTHGKCQVHFAPGNQQSSASQLSPASLSTTPLFLVRARIESLRQLATTNQAHRLAKPVVYQLFSGVVSYAPIYQAIEEVVMDHSSSDAIATVKLPDNNTAAHPGKFHTNPYWTDAVLHLAGFILNSGLRYPSDIACLATGFQMWRSSTELVAGGTYTSYVCMQEPGDGGNRVGSVVTGDCYVFDGPDLVQATLGIKFLKLKKVALSTILGLSDSAPDKHMRTEQNRHHQDNKTGDSSRYTPAISETPSIKPDLEAKTDLDNAEEIIESMLAIIAAESGCTTDDMADDSRYTDLGIDSVMSITILSIVSRNLSIDLPASFFLDNETIGESKAALRDLIAPPMSDSDTQQDSAGVSDVWTPSPHSSEERAEYVDGSRTRAPSESRPSTPWTQFDTKLEGSSPYELVPRAEPSKDAAEQQLPPSSPPPQEALPALVARVKHYQGPRSNSPGTTNIFFLADETGSTFSYMYLPSLGPQTAVYGVDSPFSAAAVRPQPGLDVPGLAAAYLAAIRAEQPSGPYVLGGAASGAVLAFECARLLLLRGEEVRGLVLLDCESPTSRNNNSGGNATSDSGYGAAAPPVVKKKRVKASVAEHVNSMTAIFDAFTEPAALSSGASGIALLVLANGPEDDGRGAKWSDLIPGLQTRRLEAVTGAFLSTVNMGELGSVISEALV